MEMIIKSPLAAALDAYEAKLPGQFRPDKKFYSLAGINRKRFHQLLRGDTKMYTEEAKKLAEILGVPVTDLF